MTGFESKRQAAQDKMELADAYASAVAATPNMPTPLERKLAVERIERARNALEAALEQQQAEPVADGDKVICPACCHQFRAIPETVQTLMLHAGFEPPFTTPPQQQAEPTCPDCKAAVLYECVVCSSNNYPPKQQAEPVAYLCENAVGHKYFRWKKPSSTYKPIALYTTSPQRKELSASEILDMMPSAIPAEYDGELMEFARAIEAKLKERNGY